MRIAEAEVEIGSAQEYRESFHRRCQERASELYMLIEKKTLSD